MIMENVLASGGLVPAAEGGDLFLVGGCCKLELLQTLHRPLDAGCSLLETVGGAGCCAAPCSGRDGGRDLAMVCVGGRTAKLAHLGAEAACRLCLLDGRGHAMHVCEHVFAHGVRTGAHIVGGWFCGHLITSD